MYEALWEPERLAAGPQALLCADLNAYHEDWASLEDARRQRKAAAGVGDGTRRGRRLKEWADRAGMRVLNDGSTTRYGMSHGVQTRTAPDATFAGKQVAERAQWKVPEQVPKRLER